MVSKRVREAAEAVAEAVKVRVIGYAPQDYWEREEQVCEVVEVLVLRLLVDLCVIEAKPK